MSTARHAEKPIGTAGPNAAERLRAIGRVTKVFGVKGEVKIESYARSLDEFASLKTVALGPEPERARPVEIEEAVARGADLYLRFCGVSDRNAAALLVGQFLFVDESERKRLPEGSYYVDDLVGMKVVGEEGRVYGTLREVMKAGGRDVYVVRTGSGDVLVPAVPAIVLSISASSRTMVLRPPEGMFGEVGGNGDEHPV